MSAEQIIIDSKTQNSFQSSLAWNFKVIPKVINSSRAILYAENSCDKELIGTELKKILGVRIEFELMEPQVIQKALNQYYRKADGAHKKSLNKNEDFLDSIIEDAQQIGSSDIHIEAFELRARVRIRIDGLLVERFSLDVLYYPEIVNKIKIRANLDISEKRLPQDGRIQYKNMDLRVSILPTLYGEKIVLRILGKDTFTSGLKKLGMEPKTLDQYLEGVKKPSGIILISGPTGSGKTTTLYATLSLLNKTESNIITIEDPIEYTLEGINQVQLKESIGLNFSSALRSFLRQDPDVIMVGEIRDSETANMAIRASLTGHLVFSTIHTNSAWGTISRLIDMGIPPFLIASTLNMSVAQRLIRLLCQSCKRKGELNLADWPSSFSTDFAPKITFSPVGCEKCHYTGYIGRKGIYEIISIDEKLAVCLKNNGEGIKEVLLNKGFVNIGQQAIELLRNGECSLEDIYPYLIDNN